MNIFDGEEPKEPFYVTYGFFDFLTKVRVSEDFHVEFNDSAHFSEALHKFRPPNPDKESNGKRALFSFCNPHDQIYLVTKVTRIFRR